MRQFVCPACAAVNRAAEGKDAAAAKCGRCGERIFTGKPVEVTGAQFEAHRRSTHGAALLLDVWAPWCGPCRAMAPQFAAAAQRLEPEVRLLKLNSDQDQNTAAALGVSGIPALFLIAGGRVVARHAGLMSAEQIIAWTRQHLAAAGA
ncbi:thioredoxin family protein [Phenylobacterium montanum]|uniref:Thiol reductase thioredoxin n=1 Tax=Phenylobacterium montanum TaxID=2823693 RepID=A0A975G099_9CAUL|nr:thioredoxin domain-containing protein [Caulobacter sp. S6]QUD88730.1 thiol reductase thioredoxin [Caulobacter sp. S6]